MLEQRPIETIENEIEKIYFVPQILGSLTMPEEAKQAYAYLAKDSDQLVIDRYAYDFDVTPIPID
jgi:hypothetical protein